MNLSFLYKKKILDYFLFITIILLILALNLKIDEKFIFHSDISTKYFQAYSVIENEFKDDIIRCKWLAEFEYCKFHIIANTMKHYKNELQGAFPVTLSYVNAFVIYYLGNPFFIWYTQILFVLLLFLLYKIYNIFVPAVLFFLTPLFWFFITFSDVALSIFFYSFVFVFLSFKEKLKVYQILILGMITGLNILFRYEGNIFISILMMFLILFDKTNRKKYIIYMIGVLLISIMFVIMNIHYYGNILGNRFDVNKETIFNWDLDFRLSAIIGNLWGIETHPVGYFKFMPYFFAFYVIFLFYRDRFTIIEKSFYYSILLSLLIILLLSPNDSNVDFGTRYLSTLLIPSVILLSQFIQILKKKLFLILISILFLISAYYNLIYANILIKINSDTKNFYESIKEDFRRDCIWIFFNHIWPNIYGIHIYQNKVIVITTDKQCESLFQLIENQKLHEKYKKILVFSIGFNMKTNNSQIKAYISQYNEDPDIKNKVLYFLKKYYTDLDIIKTKYAQNLDIDLYYFMRK